MSPSVWRPLSALYLCHWATPSSRAFTFHYFYYLICFSISPYFHLPMISSLFAYKTVQMLQHAKNNNHFLDMPSLSNHPSFVLIPIIEKLHLPLLLVSQLYLHLLWSVFLFNDLLQQEVHSALSIALKSKGSKNLAFFFTN